LDLVMTVPLLTTKFHIPATRARLVPRPRLRERLAEALARDHSLILISAPAGFGKTTLLSDWLRHLALPAAWLSLDAADNDVARFLTYVSAALLNLQPDAETLAAILPAASRPDTESWLTALINDLSSSAQTGVLVLDDYHVIDNVAVHEALAFLVDHLPAQLHVVIASRTDPPLSLARLRARDQLIELRAADLSFTPIESAVFLNEIMRLNLTQADIAALAERTEGWIAGLQMAALSLQGRVDRSGFVQAFTGSHRFVLDYLIEEVLERQPIDLQNFLLQTSILDQLTAALCDALTGRTDSQVVLQQLEQANLFIVPLDDERRWYRYHHLFADLLRSRLLQAQPDLIPMLQQRAGEWYARHGLLAEAMQAAVAAGDVDGVARLAEENVIALMDHGELSKLADWMNAVPPEVRRARPWLCVAHAWAAMYTGQMAAIEPCLQEAERVLHEHGADQDARLVGHIATIRSNVALLTGADDQAVELACDALQALTDKDYLARGCALRVLGLTYRTDGDLDTALILLREASDMSRLAGDSHLAITVLHDLGLTEFLRGELQPALTTCQEGLRLVEDHRQRGGGQLPATGYLYSLMGRVLCEQNDLETAANYAHASVALSRHWELAEVLADCYVDLSVILRTRGELDAALEAIRAARLTAQRLSEWYVFMIEPYEAHIHLARGDLAAVAAWAARQQNVTDFGRNVYTAHNGLTLARVLMAQRRYGEALPVLEQVLRSSEIVQVNDHVLEALILEALVFQGQHRIDQAVSVLQRALVLGEPRGHVRVFVDEGAPLGDLLRRAAARGIAIEYVDRLLLALQADQDRRERHLHPTAANVQPLSEPLTDRELEVLRLVAIGQSNEEIAATLIISSETVKKHLKNIYGKLEVHSRLGAVNRAREAGCL
jgi:LuxR family transcriptional regulator, maltose regulon positive regulatory protein